MPETPGVMEPLDLRSATDIQYAALTVFANRMRAEFLPDDPPIPFEERRTGWQTIPEFVDLNAWVIWTPDRTAIVACSDVGFLRMAENRHVVQFNIEVLPEYRRHGLGRQLLEQVVAVPRREGRRLMISNTSERVPAGSSFMERLGAKKAIETHTNQLVLADVDPALLRSWIERAVERAQGFELGLWTGPYPDADIEAIAALMEVMNTAPKGDLDVEDFHFGPEQVRQQEASMTARNVQRWTMYVREQATGEFAGFTEVFWHPNRLEILDQGGTGVFPRYRNLGLGRWLKAAMLEKVLRERPEVRFVRTGNADSNAPMLGINHALGFKPYIAEYGWQVETAQVERYLAEQAAPRAV